MKQEVFITRKDKNNYQTFLSIAKPATDGNLELFKEKLIEFFEDFNNCTHNNVQYIKQRINKKHDCIVDTIVKEKEDDFDPDIAQFAVEGEITMVKSLLEQGLKTESVENLMLTACYNNHLDLLKYLIDERCADYHIKENGYNFSLNVAIEGNNIEIVKYLIEIGVEVNLYHIATAYRYDLVKIRDFLFCNYNKLISEDDSGFITHWINPEYSRESTFEQFIVAYKKVRLSSNNKAKEETELEAMCL